MPGRSRLAEYFEDLANGTNLVGTEKADVADNLSAFLGSLTGASLDALEDALPIGTSTQTALDLKRTTYADKATATAASVGTSTFIELQAYSASVSKVKGGAIYQLAANDAEYTAYPSELKFTTADSKKFVAVIVYDARGAGARGDGSTDDYAALQAYAWFCGYTGMPFILPDSASDYRISAKIVFKTTRDLAATDNTPLSDLHFTDVLPFKVEGQGKAKIVATASMTSMFEFIFDTGDTDIGPFYTTVTNIQFDGNSLATACIKSDYTMHLTVENCRLQAATRGIEFSGYGVARIFNNVIRCKYGLYCVGGGGDSMISNNDFYAQEATSACIYLGYYGGNVEVRGNTFTNDQGFTGSTYCVQLAGSTASSSEEIRHVNLLNNEFCGFPTAIRADGKASGTKNVWQCVVRNNHVTPYGSTNYGLLMAAVDCRSFIVESNFGNGLELSTDASSAFLQLVRCERFIVRGNQASQYLIQAMLMTNCVDCDVEDNKFHDIGKTGTSYTCITIFGASSSGLKFKGNKFIQSSSSYAQNGVLEDTGVDGTYANYNDFTNISKPYTKVGANSVMRRVEYLSAAPTTTYHNVGDITWNTGVAAAGTPGWVCTTAGTPGTFKAMANVAA
jgi:hypothetical protein